MKVQLVTDSSADLPQEIIDQYNIEIAPLSIQFGDEAFLDKVEIDNPTFYEKMSTTKELPKTSQPSVQAFVNAFEKASKRGPVLCITLSSKISGTYQTANIAKGMVQGSIEIIDSLNLSLGIGMQVLKACELAEQNLSLDEVKNEVLKYRDEVSTIFTLNTLENVIKGGRITSWEGYLGQVLSIKPVIEVLKDGTFGKQEKVRGRKRAIKRMLEKAAEKGKDFSNRKIAIGHAMAEEEANYIRKEIEKTLNPQDIIISEIGPVIGTHGGFGTLGIIV